ncbi:tetratricopeptide repeat protein [Nonomuraea sp. B1E8]|uniref:ATP-binding protein n=1 Tax=unclassified Nonomuraea TaxID=2593643 RepID=UPI00325D1EF1
MSSEERDGADADAAEESPAAFGTLLRGWRERALLTQEELAARAGLNARTIRRLEAGDLRRPRGTSVRLLAEALGLDDAERATLTHAARGAGESAEQAAQTHAAKNAPASPGPVRVPPRHLPADVVAFTGRERELAALDGVGDLGTAGTVVITAIDGMAGVGKTALAVHAAHQLAARFPDGDLFLDLHGYTHGMVPVDPAEALARILAVLGVPGESIPQHADDRAALYRSVLADRKMLIVLDNAAEEAQVRPLLPGSGGCLVLITSRRRLIGLDDVRTVSVDVLPPAEAVALLTRTAGHERVAGEPPQALAELARRCGRLPLAIRLAAARLKAHPTWSVGHLLARLEEHHHRLGELHAGERSVTAALDLSYRGLEIAERRAYRLLGLHAGTDIAPDAAAALLATSVAQATGLLDRLLEGNLLQEPVPGRYRFHDLIRAHAAALAGQEPEAERRASVTRLLDHYSRAATAAMDRLYPYEADMRPRLPPGDGPLPAMDDAEGWLEAELPNLLALAQHAAEHGYLHHIRHLSATLHRCLRIRGRNPEAETLSTRALAAARTAADHTGEMEALIALGEIRHRQSRYETAIEDNVRALDIARATGHRSGELRALNSLGLLRAVHGEHSRSIENFAQALAIARETGHRSGQLDALIGAGHIHRMVGRHGEAAGSLAEALDIARETGHRTGEVRTLLALGHLHLGRGEYEAATDRFTRALDLANGTEHRLGQLDGWISLGDMHRIGGRYEQAHACYEHALDLARELGNRNWQFEAVHGMGRLRHEQGHHEQALDHHQEALRLATDLGQPGDQSRAHDGLAHAHAALDQYDDARHHWSQALAILSKLGTDHTDEPGVDADSIRTHLAALGTDGSELRRDP